MFEKLKCCVEDSKNMWKKLMCRDENVDDSFLDLDLLMMFSARKSLIPRILKLTAIRQISKFHDHRLSQNVASS